MNPHQSEHIEPSPEQSADLVTEKKRHHYKKELQRVSAERDDLREKLLRTAADFDNYRKRAQQEKIELLSFANAELIRKMLPVLDDMNRLAEAGSNADDPMVQGVNMIRKNFWKILQDEGLREMTSVGEPFDPDRHDALLLIETDEAAPNTVVEEHQKGYEFKDRILRHAKVIVSKEKA